MTISLIDKMELIRMIIGRKEQGREGKGRRFGKE